MEVLRFSSRRPSRVLRHDSACGIGMLVLTVRSRMTRVVTFILVLSAITVSAAVPTLRVQDRAGNEVVLPAAGTVTVVQFMATWCAPCHEETKALVELYPTY